MLRLQRQILFLQAALHNIIAQTSTQVAASTHVPSSSGQPEIWEGPASDAVDLDAKMAMLEGPEYESLMQVGQAHA